MKIILEFHTQHSTRHLAGTDELCACSTRTLRVSGLAKMEYYLQHTTHDICVTYDVPKLLGIYPSSSEKKKTKNRRQIFTIVASFLYVWRIFKKKRKRRQKELFRPCEFFHENKVKYSDGAALSLSLAPLDLSGSQFNLRVYWFQWIGLTPLPCMSAVFCAFKVEYSETLHYTLH